MQELELATTEDLIKELMKRFEHCVIAGIRTKVHTDDDILTIRRFHGNYTLCEGLCSELLHDILKQHLKEEQSLQDY